MGFNIKFQLVCLSIIVFQIWYSRGCSPVKRRLPGIECSTSTFVNARRRCKAIRAKELMRKKVFYKISGPEKHHGILHLDQPDRAVLGYFLTEKFHSHWFNLYFTLMMQQLRSHITPFLALKYRKANITSSDNYTQISEEMKDVLLSAVNGLPQFKYPSRSYDYFTNLCENDRFKRDEYFVQERLAGLNPMAMRRVSDGDVLMTFLADGCQVPMFCAGTLVEGNKGTQYSNLRNRLNQNEFDWNAAVIAITKDKDILESIRKNKVYVVEYPILKDLPKMYDLLYYERPLMKMKQQVAPIALFAVDPQKVLRVVVIQNTSSFMDFYGKVHTPQSGLFWNISKAQLQLSDGFVAQVVEHLMRTHYKMEPICIALHRHFSSLHPLHQILKYHCRGLLPVRVQASVVLLKNEKTLRSLFTYGSRDVTVLLRREYPKMVWGDIDLQENVEERGMDDMEQLPYYPYRDDGHIINEALVEFTSKLVNTLYGLDIEVKKDEELQNMIKELSEKVRGFPSEVITKQQLSKVIRQVLWIVVQHSMYTYPIAEYGHTPAIFPTKLYKSPTLNNNESFINMLPGPVSDVLQASLAYGIGTLHYDSMFDYWKELKTRKLRRVVKEAFGRMKRARQLIHNENKRRFERGQLTNPFMLPDWVPNSIST